jgi:glucose/arabinose dehydrogenase
MKSTYLAATALRHFVFVSTMLVVLSTILLMSGCKKTDNMAETETETGVDAKANHHDSPKKQVDLELLADNFVSPIGVVAVPDKSERLFVIDQIGRIWIIDKHGNKLPNPFIDLTSRMTTLNPGFDERGLLGLAFHPNYHRNGRFFVYYNAPARPGGPTPTTSWNNLARFSEFKVSSSNRNLADIGSERVLLEIDDPQSNHNGGTLAFGPDGYLYISIGDGGGANDTAPGHVPDWYLPNAGGNGQDIEANLWGSILRIDIDRGTPYGIPRDNPFVGRDGLDEIYAYGFRNPYRMSFDMRGSHRLFVGDAGQVLYEEVDVVEKGGNYGWNVKEGTHCFNAASPLNPFDNCPSFVERHGRRLIDPVIEINNAQNPAGGVKTLTVIGGNVYRGNSIPGLNGKYIFGSFSRAPGPPTGELFMAQPAGHGLWPFQEITLKSYTDHLGQFVKGFGQDLEGEIYVTTSTVLGPAGTTGKVYKLVQVKK